MLIVQPVAESDNARCAQLAITFLKVSALEHAQADHGPIITHQHAKLVTLLVVHAKTQHQMGANHVLLITYSISPTV